MKIISRTNLCGDMFITVTSRGILINAELDKALGTKGAKECYFTLAIAEKGCLALKVGEKNADAFRAHRGGNALMIMGVKHICPVNIDGKSRRFSVKKDGEWFVSNMQVIL